MQSFASLFKTRSDSNSSVYAYVHGLIQANRKNIERMEEEVEGFNYQSVHNSISCSPWDHRPVMDEVARRADGLLGGSRRVRLVYDDTGVAKKGTKSVGVARQYLGSLGKVDNGQVAVCASLASGQRATLVDVRLYLPATWAKDPARCKAAKMPKEEVVYHSKAEIVQHSVAHLRELGIRFDIIGMDSGYGSNPALLYALDDAGENFVAEVHCDQHVWTQQPWHHQQSKRPGAERLKHPKPSQASQRVDEIVAVQDEREWKRLKVRDSDQGWVEVNYTSARIWVSDGERECLWWLLSWENPDEQRSVNKHGRRAGPRRHYALSNAGADADERQLVIDAVERNVIECNFRDAKQEVGMDHYQTRSWVAWNHHMALVMLAMLFLLNEKMLYQTGSELPPLTAGDIMFMIKRTFPRRGYGACDPQETAAMVTKRWRQRANDQRSRKAKTARSRPPLAPDEFIS